MDEASTILKLSSDEALVLFDWIARFNERETESFESVAEQQVLWKLESLLEAVLTEPLDPSYRDLVRMARLRLSPADD